jgi:hypothetical protein
MQVSNKIVYRKKKREKEIDPSQGRAMQSRFLEKVCKRTGGDPIMDGDLMR